ncbi:helix-turn-helix transcriptional regulator [Stutzerimonas nitrititolerans]|uniref:helix-turn-helix transcriptional regulator n=1 Tax=Stutzerimonas nitrititolerans TaxID=2482751 RepID=UPI0028A28980|nr:transcriptional regulator [Stutzerimonas nitrititolerans]
MHSKLPFEDLTLIPQPKLCEMLGKSRSGLQKLRNNDPDFPVPVKTGTGLQARCYYPAAEINAWLNIQIKRRDQA